MNRFAHPLICLTALSTACIVTPLSTSALAQEQGFGATTDIALGTESNIYRTQDEISEQFLLIAPKLGFKELQGKHVFTLGYDGTYDTITCHLVKPQAAR